MKFQLVISFGLAAIFSSAGAHSISSRDTHESQALDAAAQQALVQLVQGNQAFRTKMQNAQPELLKQLTDEGQAPSFSFLGCSDSRVSDGTIFDALPGTFFAHRNIANVHNYDSESGSWLGYGIEHLGVQHVAVVGHYGCGGIAAAIASRPNGTVDAIGSTVEAWIDPVRELVATSSRQEIVAMREAHAALAVVPEPEFNDPGFRAVVEENAKRSTDRIRRDPIIQSLYAKVAEAGQASATAAERRKRRGITWGRTKREENVVKPVFIHTWIYNIEDGSITDLKHSYGPEGHPIPMLADVAGQQTLAERDCAASCSSARKL
ncbi:hypothetical protein FRB99_004056 [Tulasnella sp. 403]|nr:hypothetical protein FRB99_004056 [Tulasnella sp. 403]